MFCMLHDDVTMFVARIVTHHRHVMAPPPKVSGLAPNLESIFELRITIGWPSDKDTVLVPTVIRRCEISQILLHLFGPIKSGVFYLFKHIRCGSFREGKNERFRKESRTFLTRQAQFFNNIVAKIYL